MNQALLDAAVKGDAPKAGELIRKGAQVDAADGDGWTPLHIAACHGYRDVAELMVVKGADVDAADGNGRTPLFYADENGHREVAKLLFEHGADFNVLSQLAQVRLMLEYDVDSRALNEMSQRFQKAEWERAGLPAFRARHRKLGGMRPKVPSL